MGRSDPIYMTQLGHLIRFSQVSPINQDVFNDFVSSITYEDGKIPSAGNACITEICEIHEMKIHGLIMCIWWRLQCMANPM